MAVFVLATMKVKYGQLPRLSEAMAKLVPIMEERGWRLLGAYSPVVGDLTQVVDLWELPDANAVGEGLFAALGHEGYPEIAAVLSDVVETEVLQVVAKTPYSP
jgi:NIPSNAP